MARYNALSVPVELALRLAAGQKRGKFSLISQKVHEVTAGRNPSLTAKEIRNFETQFGVVLPDEYRRFLMKDGNGGEYGPRYGLLPLGTLPPHWSTIHNYSTRLRRPFLLDATWVWEDEPDAPNVESRVDATNDGVLLLGEEGCGARWLLVVSGKRAGEVWLTTGEGAAPSGLTFGPWLTRFSKYGNEWWAPIVEKWGPSPYIWFASHAIKQIYVLDLNKKGKPPEALAQTSPLCFDCIKFFARACAQYRAPLAISTPGLNWIFSAEGMPKAIKRSEQS